MKSLPLVVLAGCLTGRGLSDDVQAPDPTGPAFTDPSDNSPTQESGLRVREEEPEACDEDRDAPGSLVAELDGATVRVLHAMPDHGETDDWSPAAEIEGDRVLLSYTAAHSGSAPCTLVFDLAIDNVPPGDWTVAWAGDPSVSDEVTVP